jgi:hypothetical protein
MINPADRIEIITSVQRRRRWTASEKVRMVEGTECGYHAEIIGIAIRRLTHRSKGLRR